MAAALLVGIGAVCTPVATAAGITLDVVPEEAPAGATVSVSGSCYPQSDSMTELTLEQNGTVHGSLPVDLDSNSAFSGVQFPIPPDLAAGGYGFYTACDGEKPFTVLPPAISTSLMVDPTSGHVGDTVNASGVCDAGTISIYFDNERVATATGDSSTGAFGPTPFTVPERDPGRYSVDTTCEDSASFDVQAPPIPAALTLDPGSGRAEDEVTVTGTCPVTSDGVTVLFGDRSVNVLDVDTVTGAFGPADFAVPDDVAPGPATVTADCGGEARAARPFTVLRPLVVTTSPATTSPATTSPATTSPATTSTTATTRGATVRPGEEPLPTPTEVPTPDGPMILVPDLRGLTEDQVVASLGNILVLANPTGQEGTVRRQSPAPGTLVQPASAVTVVLDDPPAPNRLPLLLLGLLVAAAVAGLLATRHVRRRRFREKRWLDEQVRTELEPHKAVLSVVPDHAVPGIDLRLEIHRYPARL